MTDSERMTDLILEAYQRCKDNGHQMDWRRYSNYLADAECIRCGCIANVNIIRVRFKLHNYVRGAALNSKCKGERDYENSRINSRRLRVDLSGM